MEVYTRVFINFIFKQGYFKGGVRHGYGKWRSVPINGLYDEFDG